MRGFQLITALLIALGVAVAIPLLERFFDL
jgi:hypothetical protein